jgi:hypothetical protein
MNFFCVGVMYSGEYDARDVTLSVYPHRGQAWKICLATVGIESTTFGILAQRSAKYVRYVIIRNISFNLMYIQLYVYSIYIQFSTLRKNVLKCCL